MATYKITAKGWSRELDTALLLLKQQKNVVSADGFETRMGE